GPARQPPLRETPRAAPLRPAARRTAGEARAENPPGGRETPAAAPPPAPARPPPAAQKPSVEKPLVFQLFGHLGDVGSLVLTEDDYFRYLLSLAGLRAQPSLTQRLLAQSGLMFLGFRIDDWDFRVFFHFLLSRQSRKL